MSIFVYNQSIISTYYLLIIKISIYILLRQGLKKFDIIAEKLVNCLKDIKA